VAEIVEIPVVNLLLDGGNPRLEADQPGQQETALSLAEQQGERLIRLAEDIVENGGLDPTALVAVVAVGHDQKRYKVIEGNRRVLTLKGLETPSLISPALAPKDARKLAKLSSDYAKRPLDVIPCALFKAEEDALHWIELRHTGQNQGKGLVDWGSDEQDRFTARHAGTRKPAGQVIDFVEKHGFLSAEAQASNQKILTNLERLLSNPTARRKLGVDLSRGEVVALHAGDVLAKSLSRVVEDLLTMKVTVPELYKAEDRVAYAESLPRSIIPKKKTLLPKPVTLAGLTAGQSTPAKVTPKPSQKPKPPTRTTVIPKHASLNVAPPRLNAIYNELLSLVTVQFPNGCAVLLRVFIELSVDHYLSDNSISYKRADPLAKRLKLVAQALETNNQIPTQLRKAIEQVADGPSPLAPGVSTFNQYVHNKYTYPKPSELYAAWNELQPLMEKLWP
jgi:hypothetical protein